MTDIQKANRVLQQIRKIPDETISDLEKMALEQASYYHPLKCATAAKINQKGENNLFIIQKLKELREAILLNENL